MRQSHLTAVIYNLVKRLRDQPHIDHPGKSRVLLAGRLFVPEVMFTGVYCLTKYLPWLILNL